MRKLLLFILVAAPSAPCLAGGLRLVVRNDADASVTDAPITLGVPWPRGALKAPAALRLLGPGGEERPLQAEALSRWPDGSVKWALLDFLATAPRKGRASYSLDYGGAGRPPPAAPPLQVQEDAAAITVSTGAATFKVARDHFRLLDEVVLEGQKRPIVSPYDATDGLSLEAGTRRFLSSLGPARAEVETSGPVRAVVRVVGKLQAEDGATLCDYVARLHFYAGLPAARFQLTVLNREPAPEQNGPRLPPLRLTDLSVRLPLRLGGLLLWEFLGERKEASPGSLRGAGDHAELVQLPGRAAVPARYTLTQRGRTLDSGATAGGGASLWDATGGAAVLAPHLATERARSLRVLGRPRIEVGLVPREAGPCEDFAAGQARTDDVVFWFFGAERPSLHALAAVFGGAVAAQAATTEEFEPVGQWYADAGVLSLASRGVREYALAFVADVDRLLPAIEEIEPTARHRFDPALVLAREFLRRGDPRLLDGACRAARCLADAGTFHNVAGGDERLTGACYDAETGGLGLEGSWFAGTWLTGLLTGDRALLDAALKNAAFAARHADDPGVTPLAAALAVLNLCHAADVAPATSPNDAPAFQAALHAYLNRLLVAQQLGGHGLHADRVAIGALAIEALAALHSRSPDERIAPSMLRAAHALISPAAFWSGHDKVGGLRAADGAAVKPYATADGLVEDWARHPDAAVHGGPCCAVYPWLAVVGDMAGDGRFLARARRLERVAALFPCETALDFLLRYRQGDLFAAAWARYAESRPPTGDQAVGLQCRLACAADVALPDIGRGGCVLFRPFVALPDGSRACQAQAPGIVERPRIGVWFPLLDSGNAAETQGAIEFRICYRKGPGGREHTWLASGDPREHGFALAFGGDGLRLASLRRGDAPARVVAPDVKVKPGVWHHVAIAWRLAAGTDVFFDGARVGHSAVGRLALAPHLRFPCDPDDAVSEYLVRDLRIWKRPPDAFAAATDTTSPAAVTDLLLAPAEEGKMLLSWTAPGDDGTQGQARRYDIRVSSQPFHPLSWGGHAEAGDPVAAVHWAEADHIAGPPAPRPAGQLEKLLVGPLPRDRRVYIALKAEDEANASPLSNVVHTDINHPPIADAGPPLRQVITGSTVLFDARGSSDPDGDELTYEWSNGLRGPTASRRYDEPGTHEVTLAVSDGKLQAAAAARLLVGDAIRVNFQPRRSARTPDGFVPDEGLAYSKLRGYGWRVVPARASGFDRASVAALAPEARTGLAFPDSAEWAIDVPNGTYVVTLAVGDPARLAGCRRIAIEGKEAAALELDGKESPAVLTGQKVVISDGRLSLRLESASHPPGVEINYIAIERK